MGTLGDNPTADPIRGDPIIAVSGVSPPSTTTTDDVSAQDTPPVFASKEFDALLHRVNALADETSARWKLYDDRHENYMSRFNDLKHSMQGQRQLINSVVHQVKGVVDQVKDVHDIAAHTRSRLNQLEDSSSDEPSNTSNIDEAFAATDAALRSGLDDLAAEVSSHLDRAAARPRDDTNPTDASTPARHPRFTAVNDVWSGNEYDSDAAYASRHRPSLSPSDSNDLSHPSTSPERASNSQDRAIFPHPSRSHHTRGLDPHILTWHAGALGGNPITGTDFMDEHDVEALDITGSLAVNIAECHFNMVQNWENPRWVDLDRRQFSHQDPRPPPTATSGPNITDILKQLQNWDKLSDLTPTGWQTFYNKLRRFSEKWKIALMPFEAINLKYECQGHGLCICGLGVERWRRMGDALFLILENLLPSDNAIISTTMTSLANGPSAANGYELLWTLLKEFIPMFDRTQPAPFPTWPASDDIFDFGRLVLMYCDLSRHRGPAFTEAMKSRMFLLNVQGHYTTLAQPFSALVNTYCPGRDGITRSSEPLPNHLTVMELARSFYDSTALQRATPPMTRPPHSIHAYRTSLSTPGQTQHVCQDPTHIGQSSLHSTSTPGLVTASSTLTSDNRPTSSGSTRPTHLQGFSINTTRAPPPTRSRSQPNPARRNSSSDAPQRTRYEGTCDACGKYGHPANRCDMLAMAIFLQRYSRNKLNVEVIKEAEERWTTRNKPYLPRDDRTPRTILANYCAELQFDEDKVDAELDWEFLYDPASVDDDVF